MSRQANDQVARAKLESLLSGLPRPLRYDDVNQALDGFDWVFQAVNGLRAAREEIARDGSFAGRIAVGFRIDESNSFPAPLAADFID